MVIQPSLKTRVLVFAPNMTTTDGKILFLLEMEDKVSQDNLEY